MKKILFILTLSLLCAGMSWAQNVIFVKSGVTDGDIITVGSETGAAYTTLKEAVAHSSVGDIVKLTEDVTEAGTITHPYGALCCVVHDRITIDGCGHSLTVTGISGGYSCAIYTKGGTIKNLNVTGGFRVIFSGGSTADINIDNCVIDAGSTGAYTFNSDAAGPYALNITNTTLKGWTSYTTGYTSSTIANNTFDKCSYLNYGYYRPYIPTIVESCNFPSSDFWVDASTETRPDGGGHGNILFNECTYLGAPLTQNNVEQLLDQDWSTPVTHNYAVPTEPMTRNNDGEITGGVFSGTVSFLETLLAYGYEAYPLGTDPETYRVTPVYYIHYNANGGSGTMEDSYVPREAPNNVFTVPACTFTHASFPFLKWNTKAYGNGTDLAENDPMTLTSDTTLYAIWNCVAMIGTTCYATLDAAIDAAVANDVIEIIASTCEITNTKVLPANVTLKGQGKNATTMTIASTSGSGLTINNAGVTIKDMHIDGSQITSGGYKTLVNVRADNVVIDNVIMSGGGMSTWNSSILVETLSSSQTFTVSNSTISGSFRGVLRESCNANIVITNCDIDAIYPFNIDGGSGGTVTVTGGSLRGWTSYGGVDKVSFTDVDFGKGTAGYAVLRPYVNTEINGSSFSSEFKVDPIIAPSILFNNCDLAGTPLTSANIDNLLKDQATNQAVSQEDPRSHAVVVNGGYSTNDNDEITGGIYGGNPEVLNTMIASGYAAFPLNTDPQTYQVDPAYFIHFNAAGGTGTHGDSVVMRANPTFVVPANTEFTYGSYGFLNWNSKPYGAGTDIAVGSTMTLSSDTTLYAEWNIDFVAKIGSTTYPTFQAAIDDATTNMTGDVTIELMKNIKEWVLIVQKSGLNLTIDGHSTTLTGQIIIDGEARHCGTETLEIKDLNFAYEADAFATYTNSTTLTNGFVVTPTNKGPADAPYKTSRNYIYSHNITVKDCNFDGAGSTEIYAFKGAWGSNPRNIKLDNCTAKNVFGFAFFAGVSHCDAVGTTGIEITDCEATENIQQALYISGGGSSTHNITGNTFTAEDFALYIDNAVNNPTYNLSGNTMTADTVFKLKLNDNGAGGAVASTTNINIDGGTYIGDVVDYDPETHLNISGGIYSEDVSGEPCEEGYAAFKNGTTPETWTVTKAWFLRYNANGGTGTTMDSVFVKQSDDAAGRTVTVADCDYTYDSYAFAEWNTKADGTGNRVAPGAQLTLTQDTVLYAQWARVKNATQGILYDNLQTAINAAAAGDSIVVMTDLSSSVFININKSIIINGGKHTLTSTATRGFRITQSNLNVTIRNLNEVCPLNPISQDYRGISFDLDLSNVNLLVDSCRITGSDYAINLTPGNTGHAVTVKNSYIQGWAALNSFAQNTAFTFVNDTLHGINKGNCSSSTSMYYATICLDGGSILGVTGTSNTTLDIQNSVVIAQENTDCVQRWIDVKYGASICEVSVDGNTKIIDGDENDVTSKLYVYGAKNTVTLPLTAEEKAVLAAKYYTLTDNPDGSTRVSHSIRYTQDLTANTMYIDFHYPFVTHTLAANDKIELLEDVTMTQEVYAPFDGNFTLHFKDGSEEHSITQGDYTIVLDDDQTCTTDKQALALFSSINGSSITETDNNNDTWTYSVTPYNIITYYSNNSADEEDAQTKPNGETVNLYDYNTFDHADSTIYRWNTQADGNGTDYALGAAYSANADLDLYAVWLLNLNMTMDSTDVVCYGENNGTDTVKIIGGEAPFQIVLSSTVMAENDTVKNLMDRTHIFTNLKPGKYNVQLTDVLKKDTIRGTFTIAQPDTLEITALTVPEDFPCPLMGNGSYDVSVTAQGGNGGYHYTWSEAAVNIDAAATTVVSGADDRDSIYTVKVVVTDSKNCTAEGIKTFTVSKVIADDGTVHSNSKLTIDTIRVGIMSGCDTVYKEYGTPVFTTTIPGGYPEDRLTIVNNIATAYPDSVFYLGENKIIWTATDTCGHSITGEQVLIVYHFPCPNVTDVDGNDYTSVRLGCDCWMAENLRTSKYSDGRDVSNLMKYESPTHPDADANFAIYGYLYDWTAALDAESGVTPDADGNVQGICPTGWHLPSDIEFANVAGLNGTNEISDLRYHGYWLDGGGNNSTNFSLLPGGCYNDNTARYENLLGNAYLWSVNSADPNQPKVFWADCHCYMWQVGNPSANMGCSVRCVKD